MIGISGVRIVIVCECWRGKGSQRGTMWNRSMLTEKESSVTVIVEIHSMLDTNEGVSRKETTASVVL